MMFVICIFIREYFEGGDLNNPTLEEYKGEYIYDYLSDSLLESQRILLLVTVVGTIVRGTNCWYFRIQVSSTLL